MGDNKKTPKQNKRKTPLTDAVLTFNHRKTELFIMSYNEISILSPW